MYIGRMISLTSSIRIARPVDEVFALLADPLRFPLWNSAVTAVEGTGPTYTMRRSLPSGQAVNGLEVDVPGPRLLVGRAVKHGIDANLATLRDALERGGVDG
jgi:uncharacterized protein YndB with AHSA1/START domain